MSLFFRKIYRPKFQVHKSYSKKIKLRKTLWSYLPKPMEMKAATKKNMSWYFVCNFVNNE